MNETTQETTSEEAQAFAETIRDWNEKNGSESESGEPLLAETSEGPVTTDESEPPTAGPTAEAALWQNVAAVSAEVQTKDEEVDYIEDKRLVDLSQAEVTSREIQNGERLAERTRLETELETKRAEAKAIKTEIDEVQAEIDQGIKETSTRRALVTKRWRVVSDFRTNTERWYDPDDGRMVEERAIPSNRKQVALPFAETTASSATPSADDVDFDDGGDDIDGDDGEEADDEADDESPVLEDRLDRAIEEADTAASATPSDGDPADDDDVEIDGLAILEGAPPEPVVSEPPAKPSRRAKKAKA